MAIERFLVGTKIKSIIAIKVDFSLLTNSEFLTDDSQEFQCGFGVVDRGYEFEPHMHKINKRSVVNTSEFIQVLSGHLKITIYDPEERIVDTVDVTSGQGFLQFFGGHAIVAKDDTRYFELKQGPYYGYKFDKQSMKNQ